MQPQANNSAWGCCMHTAAYLQIQRLHLSAADQGSKHWDLQLANVSVAASICPLCSFNADSQGSSSATYVSSWRHLRTALQQLHSTGLNSFSLQLKHSALAAGQWTARWPDLIDLTLLNFNKALLYNFPYWLKLQLCTKRKILWVNTARFLFAKLGQMTRTLG